MNMRRHSTSASIEQLAMEAVLERNQDSAVMMHYPVASFHTELHCVELNCVWISLHCGWSELHCLTTVPLSHFGLSPEIHNLNLQSCPYSSLPVIIAASLFLPTPAMCLFISASTSRSCTRFKKRMHCTLRAGTLNIQKCRQQCRKWWVCLPNLPK